MSFLGDPRNMAEIDKDQLKHIDITYIFPDDMLYSGNPIDGMHLMERISEQVTAVGGTEPAQTSQFVEQLMMDVDSLIPSTAAPPSTTTAQNACPYSTHDGCGCPPGKAWNYKGLFKIFKTFEIFNILNIRTKFEHF